MASAGREVLWGKNLEKERKVFCRQTFSPSLSLLAAEVAGWKNEE